MKKKLAALLLSVCLVLTLSPTAFSTSAESTSSMDVYVTNLDPGYYMCAVWDGDLLLCLFDCTVGNDGIMDKTVDIGQALPSGTQVKVGISSANTGGKKIDPVMVPVYDTSGGNKPSQPNQPSRPSGSNTQVVQTPARRFYNISIAAATGGTVTSPAKSTYPDVYVLLTVTPDPGYKVGSIYAADSAGNNITVPNFNGQYRFHMPASNVTVHANFVPASSNAVSAVNKTAPALKDVDSSKYYYASANWAVSQGIMDGFVNTIFEPKAQCTRSQVALFLWRAMGSQSPSPDTVNPFDDIRSGQIHYPAIMQLMEHGIIAGTSPTKFSPGGSITRAQVVAMLYRAAGSPAVDGSVGFSDVPADAYYANAVQWAVNRGIAAGTSPTKFSPKDSCNRAQIVTFLYRFCGSSGGATNTAYPNTVPSEPSAPTPVITPEPVVTPEPEAPKPQGLSISTGVAKNSMITGSAYTVQFQLSASATGGTGDYEYRFEILQNGECTDSTDWSDKNAISGELSGNGTCAVRITVRDSSGETASTEVDLLETDSIRR